MPTVERLTHQRIKGLAAEEGEDYTEYWEENFPRGSFGVRVSGRTGRKKFILRYYNAHGQQRRITLGGFAGDDPGGLSLSAARDQALQIVGDVAAGEDPARKQNEDTPDTVRELIEEFLEVHGQELADLTLRDYRQYFNKDVLPRWGDWHPTEVDRGDVVRVLDHIALDRDAPTTSNRTRAAIHKLFEWAISRGLLTENPARGVPKRGREETRERVLDDGEIRTLLDVLEEEPPVTSHLFRFLLATGQRLGETRKARWENVDGDMWTIPGEDAKNGRTHRVPLSDFARGVLEDLREHTGDSDYVFASPSPQKAGEPIRWTHDALKRIRKACGFEFRTHDLRRTAASGMARLGTDRVTISKVLNHKSTDASVTAVYDRYDRDAEKRKALEEWGKHLEGLSGDRTEEQPGGG